MLDVFSPLHSILKRDESVTDNVVFKLHYRLTAFVLIAFSVLVTCKQFFGEPITCFTAHGSDIPESALNAFCWMQSTFSVVPPDGSSPMTAGREVAYPGLSAYNEDKNRERIFHQYYQWVCFVLFFQAMFFYLPHFVWKLIEGGKIKQIVVGLDSPIIVEVERRDKIRRLAIYLSDYLGTHKKYAAGFVLCETLNFVNVLTQIYVTDLLLGGQFSTYGTDVLHFATTMHQNDRTDPMVRVFPRMTKCVFRKVGPTGDVLKHDVLCVLSLNVVNEKIFVFVWFWFVALSIVSALMVVYRIAWLADKRLRLRSLDRRHRFHQRLTSKFDMGDCLLMQLLHKNLSPLHYRELMHELDNTLLVPTDPDRTEPIASTSASSFSTARRHSITLHP